MDSDPDGFQLHGCTSKSTESSMIVLSDRSPVLRALSVTVLLPVEMASILNSPRSVTRTSRTSGRLDSAEMISVATGCLPVYLCPTNISLPPLAILTFFRGHDRDDDLAANGKCLRQHLESNELFPVVTHHLPNHDAFIPSDSIGQSQLQSLVVGITAKTVPGLGTACEHRGIYQQYT